MRLALILAVALLAGCITPGKSQPAYHAPAVDTDLEGSYEARAPHTTLNRFTPYASYRLAATGTATTLTADWPGFGVRTVAMAAGDWNYGDRGEWRGSFEADGKVWSVRAMVDVQGTFTIALTDGGTEGRSDTIVWRCIPSAAG